MTANQKHYNVLFLCTYNSTLTIMAEAILNYLGNGAFNAFSAGSHPAEKPRPEALEQIVEAGMSTDGLWPKSWEMFAWPGAPLMDFVITLCDEAAGRPFPQWAGKPIVAHWSLPNIGRLEGPPEEINRAFHDAFTTLVHRINSFVSLPFDKLSAPEIEKAIEATERSSSLSA